MHLSKHVLVIFTLLLATGCSSNFQTKRLVVEVQHAKKAPLDCRSKTAGSILLNGIIGGVVGNQFGKGNGKKAATVAGALIAATATAKANVEYSKKSKCKSDGYTTMISYVNPFTNRLEHQEKNLNSKYQKGTVLRIDVRVKKPDSD
jgi:uncharacterized protein YcfJ